MAPIGIALVGCGQIAGVHLRAIAALQGQATLVRTVDADADRAAKAATAHGASHWGTDLDEALADERVDAAVMCLPHDLHRDFAVKAAQAGKHVLMEKPMALDEAEAKAMVEAAESLA